MKSLVIWVIRVPWQSKQNGAGVDVSAEIVSYSHIYWKKYDCNWVTKLRSRYYCNMSRIRPRLIRCHWPFDPWWVKISGHSDHVGLLRTLSTIDTQKSKLGMRLVLEVLAKLMVGENSSWEFPKVGVSYIRGASYIRDKTVCKISLSRFDMLLEK